MDDLKEHRMMEHSRLIQEELERLREARKRNRKNLETGDQEKFSHDANTPFSFHGGLQREKKEAKR